MLRRISGMVVLSILLLSPPLCAQDCEKARAHFREALALDEDLPNLIKKEQLYSKAIELCPSYAEVHNNLGDVYEKQKRVEEAIAQYKKAADLKPSFAIAHFGLGDVYFKTSRYREAIQAYERGLAIEPGDALSRERLAKARAILEDIRKSGVIKAETITATFTTSRGLGDVVPLTFGEGLIPFDYDKSNVREDAKRQLDEIGKGLREILARSKDISVEAGDTSVIEIAGHTDCRGTDAYNLNLSMRRAQSVVNYLVEKFSIPKERLIAKGYGERVALCQAAICTKDSPEVACHALNRRVEIVKHPAQKRGGTRSPSFRDRGAQEIKMELGFFYQKEGSKLVEIIRDGETNLRSRSDRYLLFFRPLQDCYVYILQEDAKGNVDLLFPVKGDEAHVVKGKDYWVPSFGKAFTLDETKGEEKIYLVATSWSLESAIEGLSVEEQVRSAVRTLQTRTIRPVRPSKAPEHISSDELNKNPQKIEELLERVEGEGGWVKVVKFKHE